MSEERLDRIEAKVDALAGDVDRRLDALGIEMRTLNQETRHEMRVLHEEVLDRIVAWRSIEGRLEPLEAAERARHRKT